MGKEKTQRSGGKPMITRRMIGLIILAVIIVVGLTLYFVFKRKTSYVESELTIRKKKDIKGK